MWGIREWASPHPTPPHTYLLLRRGNKKQWIALLSNFSFHTSTFHKHCWPCNCLLHFLAGGRGRCMPWHTCRGQRTSSGVSSLNPPHGPQPWGQASLSTETSRQPTVYPVIFCSVCFLLFGNHSLRSPDTTDASPWCGGVTVCQLLFCF